jgi:endoglucanase
MMKLCSLIFFLIHVSIITFCQTNTEFFFHRSKGDIIGTNGQRFNIKATNTSCWLYQENYILGGAQNIHETAKLNLNEILGPNAYNYFSKKMMENFITSEDIKLMKKMGFNSVRVGFSAEMFENDSTKSWLFSGLDKLLPVFKENNIAIILTMMRAPNPQNNLWTSNYSKGVTMLWDSEEAKLKTIELWSEIASRYKTEQIILGYDIINEPNISKKRERELIDLYKKITVSIREQDKNHMIIYEGNGFAGKMDVLSQYDSLLDPNGCYQFHFYSWFGNKIEKDIPKFMKKTQLNNRPIFCGEFGINRLITIRDQINFMNATKDMDGWAMYTWKTLELNLSVEERKRPPYYGKWFFIPFKDLHMSIMQFYMDEEMRDVMDWLTNVRGSTRPDATTTKKVIDKIIMSVEAKNCKIDTKHLEVLRPQTD